MNYQDITASNPHVQELIARFNNHQELDSGVLDRGEKALVGAVFMDALDNPSLELPEHIEYLVIDINARLKHWEDNR